MASNRLDLVKGYKCEFIDPVPEDFYCKKCKMVARILTVCNLCMESYCYACITDTQKQGKPCLTCKKKNFQALPQVKFQKRMKELWVYCSLKERGCGWSGTLDQLDTHLDPDQDNCQYVDTECPLHCKQVIPKNKVKQHEAEECVKRDYFCQYCSFKASYEEVVDKHLPKCLYVPLNCPNMCGVTFERDFLEYHLKQCSLQKIECEFSGVGCKDRFKREDQEEHTRENSHKHLTLTASLAKQLQQKLEEQDKKHGEEEIMLRKKIEDQKKTIKDLKKIMNAQKEKIKEREQVLETKYRKLEETIMQLEVESRKAADLMKFGTHQTLEIKNCSTKIKRGWNSPAMYTHRFGYKFRIEIYVNRFGYVCVTIHSIPGKFDSLSEWPAKANFTIELVNQQGGRNALRTTTDVTWRKPKNVTAICVGCSMVMASNLPAFLINGILYCRIYYKQLQYGYKQLQ